MTIKDFASQIGVSDKAIYKRLKREGIALSSMKTKGSSALSPEGEARLRELYSLQASLHTDGIAEGMEESELPGKVESRVENKVENSTSNGENSPKEVEIEVENSTGEVERLKAEIKRLEELNKVLTDERDYLREALKLAQVSLDRAQQLQALATSKIPALPAGGEDRGVRAWFRRLLGK